MSAIFHEYLHAWMADHLGDPTAKNEGRLTLNPIPHLDLVGSIILPILTVLGANFIFAWAKPVPFNPYNLRDKKYGAAKVAAAGPIGNLLLALVFGILYHIFPSGLITTIVYVNVILAVFNLIPIPPLDGSKILLAFLPPRWQYQMYKLERYSMIILLVFVFFLYPIITPIIDWLFRLFIGF
jgi:Zn-dependent protease